MDRTGWHPRLAAVVVAAAVIVAGSGWPSAPAGAGQTIVDQAAAVVAADRQPGIDATRNALAAAGAQLAAARQRAGDDQRLLAGAADQATRSTAAVATDLAALRRDTVARDAARIAAGVDRRRLGAIAVELYVGPEVTPVGGPDGLVQEQEQEFATEAIGDGATALISDLHRHQAEQRAATRDVGADTARAETDRATLARATALRDDRVRILTADQAAVDGATTSVAVDQGVLASATAAQARAVAAVANPPGTPADGSPSIVGVAALDAAQLVGWYDAGGWADLTPAPIGQLVDWYLSEGAAEGVRGDVAFAQAMVETGGFSSDDAVALNNYAGIGHCDSCASGLTFGSPQLGVRGQVQLLHSFADGSLTTARLGRPLAVAVLTPQTQPDRGCCATFQSLTGKWATDPLYGHTVMGVYQSMVAYALANPAG